MWLNSSFGACRQHACPNCRLQSPPTWPPIRVDRDCLKLPRALFGRIVNDSDRTIAKVAVGPEEIEEPRRLCSEVFHLTEARSEIVDSRSLSAWFVVPNEEFGGLKPVDVIELVRIHRLCDMAFRSRTGMHGGCDSCGPAGPRLVFCAARSIVANTAFRSFQGRGILFRIRFGRRILPGGMQPCSAQFSNSSTC